MEGTTSGNPAPTPRRLAVAIMAVGAALERVCADTARLNQFGRLTPDVAASAHMLRMYRAQLERELACLRVQLAAARR